MSKSMPQRAVRPAYQCLFQQSHTRCLYQTTQIHKIQSPSHNRRNLSTTSSLYKDGSTARTPKRRNNVSSGPAMFLRIQDEMKKAQSGTTKMAQRDFGVNEHHFIRPSWKRLYNICGPSPRKWWAVLKTMGVKRFQHAVGVINFKRAMGLLSWNSGKDQSRRVAAELYEKVFTALGKGDLGPVEDEMCEGLTMSCQKRINARENGLRYRWTLHRMVEKPRLMSFMCMGLNPDIKKGSVHGLIQAVVRLHTVQSLQREKVVTRRRGSGTKTERFLVDAEGRRMEEPKEDEVPASAKPIVEYFVVQKYIYQSKEEPWMAWGTTQETDVNKLIREDADKRMRKKEAKLGRKDRPSKVID